MTDTNTVRGLLKNIGPGAIVTAAFIGPGTVTACTLTGANFGYALLWVLVFDIIPVEQPVKDSG